MSKTTILEVYKDKKGLYQFKLVSKTGATVFLSEKFEKKAQVMGTVKRLAEWVSKATLVDADKKADAASKTTAKQPVKKVAPKVEAKAATKKPASKKSCLKQPVEATAQTHQAKTSLFYSTGKVCKF